jgi:hypothetical protein
VEFVMSIVSSRPTFEVNRTLVGSGVVLVCVGGVVWLGGALLTATAVAQAVRHWVKQLDEPPSAMARRRADQLKLAVAAGSKAWRDQTSAAG